MKKQVKKMMFFNSEDKVCMPFILILDGKLSCREFHMYIFKFLYPVIEIPKELQARLNKLKSNAERLDMAFKLMFEDSTFGEEELYEIVLLNNRDSGDTCPNCRTTHKGHCKLDFKQKDIKSFLNYTHQDIEI